MLLSRGLGSWGAVLVVGGLLVGCAQVNKAPVEDRGGWGGGSAARVDPATLPGAEPADPAAGNSLMVQDDTELALIERPVSVPHPQPVANTLAPVRAAASVSPSPPAASKADDLAGQPNLAPHRDRVEYFRQLLARQSG